jgi:hypothetical protein
MSTINHQDRPQAEDWPKFAWDDMHPFAQAFLQGLPNTPNTHPQIPTHGLIRQQHDENDGWTTLVLDLNGSLESKVQCVMCDMGVNSAVGDYTGNHYSIVKRRRDIFSPPPSLSRAPRHHILQSSRLVGDRLARLARFSTRFFQYMVAHA